MKKILALVFSIVLSMAILSGCGKDTPVSSDISVSDDMVSVSDCVTTEPLSILKCALDNYIKGKTGALSFSYENWHYYSSLLNGPSITSDELNTIPPYYYVWVHVYDYEDSFFDGIIIVAAKENPFSCTVVKEFSKDSLLEDPGIFDKEFPLELHEDIKKCMNDTISDSGYTIVKIDPDKLVIGDTFPQKASSSDIWADELAFSSYFTPKYPGESNAAVKTIYYPGKSLGYHYDFQRIYAFYYPKFDQLKSPGANKIRKYYNNLYKQTKAWQDEYVVNSYTDYLYESLEYELLDWDSHTAGNYLVVKWHHKHIVSGTCGGGYGGEHFDNFDLKTGKLLTFENVFGNLNKAVPILGAAIKKHCNDEGNGFYIYKLDDYSELFDPDLYHSIVFSIEENGILFDSGTHTNSYTFSVLVPYSELQEILKIDMP